MSVVDDIYKKQDDWVKVFLVAGRFAAVGSGCHIGRWSKMAMFGGTSHDVPKKMGRWKY